MGHFLSVCLESLDSRASLLSLINCSFFFSYQSNCLCDPRATVCAERSGVTRATITGLLDGLEKDDLVERQHRKDDRRMLSIHLTQKRRVLCLVAIPIVKRDTANGDELYRINSTGCYRWWSDSNRLFICTRCDLRPQILGKTVDQVNSKLRSY